MLLATPTKLSCPFSQKAAVGLLRFRLIHVCYTTKLSPLLTTRIIRITPNAAYSSTQVLLTLYCTVYCGQINPNECHTTSSALTLPKQLIKDPRLFSSIQVNLWPIHATADNISICDFHFILQYLYYCWPMFFLLSQHLQPILFLLHAHLWYSSRPVPA